MVIRMYRTWKFRNGEKKVKMVVRSRKFQNLGGGLNGSTYAGSSTRKFQN